MAMEDRETFSLIGSDEIEGTNVYGPDAEKSGYIERVMIDFGGLLGIGYDTALADAELRHQPRRLRHRNHPGPASRRPQIRARRQLELERPRAP